MSKLAAKEIVTTARRKRGGLVEQVLDGELVPFVVRRGISKGVVELVGMSGGEHRVEITEITESTNWITIAEALGKGRLILRPLKSITSAA